MRSGDTSPQTSCNGSRLPAENTTPLLVKQTSTDSRSPLPRFTAPFGSSYFYRADERGAGASPPEATGDSCISYAHHVVDDLG